MNQWNKLEPPNLDDLTDVEVVGVVVLVLLVEAELRLIPIKN